MRRGERGRATSAVSAIGRNIHITLCQWLGTAISQAVRSFRPRYCLFPHRSLLASIAMAFSLLANPTALAATQPTAPLVGSYNYMPVGCEGDPPGIVATTSAAAAVAEFVLSLPSSPGCPPSSAALSIPWPQPPPALAAVRAICRS